MCRHTRLARLPLNSDTRTPLTNALAAVFWSWIKVGSERSQTLDDLYSRSSNHRYALAVVFGAVAGVLSLAVLRASIAITDPLPRFEVASVKLAGAEVGSGVETVMKGGPEGGDPTQLTYLNVTLRAVILRAFGIKRFQLVGPTWLSHQGYNIIAKVPAGAPTADIPLMLRQLLAERFGLAAHEELRTMAVYDLIAPDHGNVLRHVSSETLSQQRHLNPEIDSPKLAMFSAGGLVQVTAHRISLKRFVEMIAGVVDRPLFDRTNLDGEYDFSFSFETEQSLRREGEAISRGADNHAIGNDSVGSGRGIDIFTAVEKDLGLKLSSRRAGITILVVDSVQKTPTEN